LKVIYENTLHLVSQLQQIYLVQSCVYVSLAEETLTIS